MASRPPEVILDPFNVILPEILPALDFDEHKRFVTRVTDTVETTDRYVNRITCANPARDAFKDHLTNTGNDEPVLGSMGVALITQSLTRLHHNRLDLEAVTSSKHRVLTPWAYIVFVCHRSISP